MIPDVFPPERVRLASRFSPTEPRGTVRSYNSVRPVTRSTTIPCLNLRQRFARVGALVPVFALALLAACGNDNGTGPSGPPAGLQVVAGDDQLGTVGAPVPTPPTVRVRDGLPGLLVREGGSPFHCGTFLPSVRVAIRGRNYHRVRVRQLPGR